MRELLPELAVIVVGQQLLLPGAVQEGSRLPAQALGNVTVIDAASAAGWGRGWYVDSRQTGDVLAPHEHLESVVVQVERDALTD